MIAIKKICTKTYSERYSETLQFIDIMAFKISFTGSLDSVA